MSLKLCLSNFRQHEQFTLETEATGFIRLNGPSGKGKSTILNAVAWVLFANMRKVQTWGSNTCKVELEAFGLQAERAVPNALTVNGLTGKAAQSQIEACLGMNEVEFMNSSYIQQKQQESLINLGAKDQLELIFQLTFKTDNPEEYKVKIKEWLATAEKANADALIQQQFAKNEGNSLVQSIDTMKTTLLPATEEVDPESVESFTEGIEKANLRKNELQKQLDFVERQRSHLSRKHFDTAKEFVASKNPELAEQYEWLKQGSNKAVVYAVSAYQDKMSPLQQQRAEVVKKIEHHRKMLTLAAGKERLLETHERNTTRLVDVAGKVVSELKEELVTGLKLSSEAWLTTSEAIKKSANINASKEEEAELYAKIKEIDKQCSVISEEQARVVAHNSRLKDKQEAYEDLKARITKAEQLIAGAHSLWAEDRLAEHEHKTQAELREVSEVLHALTVRKADVLRAIADRAHNDLVHSQIATLRTKLDACKKRVETRQATVDAALLAVEKYNKLLVVVNKAALDSIEATIQEINIRAEYWLEKMFDGDLQAVIKTSKKLKSKDETVDKLHVELTYLGHTLDSQSELSGGQESRLALAFQLALSDMYNSPILLLDEALKGCDKATMENCLEAIRDISERKLVIMVEHFANDCFFDRVVEI